VTLLDGQLSYNGLTFGMYTDYLVTLATDLEGVSIRSGDRELPRGHGSVPGPHFAVARQPVLDIAVGGTTAQMDALVQDLADTFAPQSVPLPLVWKRPDIPERVVYARPLQFAPPRSAGLRRLKVALTCADPRIYSNTTRTVSVPRYTASGGGIEWPVDWPLDFSAGVSLDATATNAGAADAYPTVRFFGPTDGGTVTSVTLTNVTTGESITIATTITAGQTLTFDGRAFITGSGDLVVGLDGASRYGSWTQPRVPLRIPPGDSLLRFTTAGTSTAVACVLSYQDVWLS
jgi:hypothetical protein